MRKSLLFLMIPLLLFSCKAKERRGTLPVAENLGAEVLQQADRPNVSTVEGKYNFIDSTLAKVFMRLKVTQKGELASVEELNKVFQVQWTLQTDFGIREKLESGKLAFIPEFASSDGEYQYLVFDVPRLREHSGAILLVEFIHPPSGTRFNFDMAIDFLATRSISRFEIYSDEDSPVPVFKKFVKVNEPFVVKSVAPSDEKLYLINYRNLSKSALSPMSGSKRELMSEFQVVKTIEIKDREPLKITEPGMYLLTQAPDSIPDGYGFLVVDERFPRITNPDILREALVYMSTSKEIESFQSHEDAKDGLDMHFLGLADGDQELARKIIRNYYQRIEEANRFFTGYKDGWKTDRGMVYTIMGSPAKIQRNRNREVWIYSKSKNISEIIYTFYKKPNLFTEDNYELVRYPEYSAFWYPYVEAWRTGKVGE